jgi:hypothetical protein
MSEPSPSPYLSLRQAVRPAIIAHRLLAADQERAGQLAAECEALVFLTRELLKATGRVRLLAGGPAPEAAETAAAQAAAQAAAAQAAETAAAAGDRQAGLLEAYADAGLLWAKVVGSSVALAGELVDRGDWDDARRLAAFLSGAGEDDTAAELRVRLGQAVWDRHRAALAGVSSRLRPPAIRAVIDALRAVLREAPEEFPDRNREVNRYLPALAASIHALMRERGAEIPYTSRVEHIAAGGVAKYPDIVTISLDELAAEFDGICGPEGD